MHHSSVILTCFSHALGCCCRARPRAAHVVCKSIRMRYLGALRWDTRDSDGSKGWSEGWRQGEWPWSVPKRQGKKSFLQFNGWAQNSNKGSMTQTRNQWKKWNHTNSAVLQNWRDQRNEVGRAEKGKKKKKNMNGEERKEIKQGRVNLCKMGENTEKIEHRKFMQVSKIGFQYWLRQHQALYFCQLWRITTS